MKSRRIIEDDYNPRKKKHSKVTNNNTVRNIMFSLIACILAGIMLFMAPQWFSQTEEGLEEFSFYSSLVDETTELVPKNFTQTLIPLVKQGKSVKILFTIENGKNSKTETFEINNLSDLQTQERYQLFKEKEKDLKSMILRYEDAITNLKPFKAFAICFDVTEGYKETSLEKYLDKENIEWINDSKKESSIYLFSIGYNTIPGWKTWENASLSVIENQSKNFLSKVEKPLPNSEIFAQIHYIMEKMSKFNQSEIFIISDMMENTNDLSAYKKNSPEFVNFINESEFPKKSDQKSVVTVMLPENLTGAFGRNQDYSDWYDAIKKYLKESYPECKFRFNF